MEIQAHVHNCEQRFFQTCASLNRTSGTWLSLVWVKSPEGVLYLIHVLCVVGSARVVIGRGNWQSPHNSYAWDRLCFTQNNASAMALKISKADKFCLCLCLNLLGSLSYLPTHLDKNIVHKIIAKELCKESSIWNWVFLEVSVSSSLWEWRFSHSLQIIPSW